MTMKNIALLAIAPLFLVGCVGSSGVGKTVKFEKPDIKDDFCGVHLNFQYCKCAFHNQYCDTIGLNKSASNTYVQEEYQKWLDQQRAEFSQACVAAGGIDRGDACDYCQQGFVQQADSCVPADAAAGKPQFQADGPLTAACEIKQEEFDRDWKKYSDIDERIPFEERSYEAKQALTSYDAMIDLMVEGFSLERDREVENQMQTELETYRDALVKDLKTNLLKAFWRLSWVTYTTVQNGKGLGESYANLLTTGASVETIGSGLKVIQGSIPNDSSLAIDTSTISGKAKSVGAAVALEAIDSLGDPVKIATEFFKSTANAPLPSADLTPEEVAILKNQHLTKGVVDEILAESRAANQARADRIAGIEVEIAALQNEIDNWEAQEKIRVQVLLQESCRQQRLDFEQQSTEQ